ncbi:GPI-GlcNAc transferase complex, PIG-H component-domain-containing protein [Biscogniauxia mediterranea]|nr:GPI-GlcNAc transferase complex, PIG-H component-domain-containing protein [Biscogniauxia mediterranea]
MFTTTPYLRIRRPSPTTAEFTVSTLPPLTPGLRVLLLALNLLRGALCLQILLVLYALWTHHYPQHSSSSSPITLAQQAHQLLLSLLTSTPPGHLASRIARSRAVPGWALASLCAGALYAAAAAGTPHADESLLVLRGLGIQTTSGGGRFIPTGKIRDVLVNEAFRGFEVRAYLAVVVDGEDDLVVVFPRLLPGARIVERVWAGVRECLWEEEEEEEGKGKGRGRGEKGVAAVAAEKEKEKERASKEG